MKVATYNVNGIRAALRKGLTTWLTQTQPDVLCLQEVKAEAHQVECYLFEAMGYEHIYWYPAEKKGYSGVAILSKVKADHVEQGIGLEAYDREGRHLRADFGSVSVMSLYAPSGTTGTERQDFKFAWMDDFYRYINDLKQTRPQLLLCGDFNICHTEIDIHNPQRNQKTSGFLPEERQWMGQLLAAGFVDSFRTFEKAPHHYTWWSYRAGARSKNLGWRIDYALASEALAPKLTDCTIHPEAQHSDHCPVMVSLEGA